MAHLSIGEVLGLLLEEFPDVTISKIRFLESQGLIDPERTASGYRKFYDDDVELLRCILREQRENYLPLRVIKDRIDSGEIDPTGEHLQPRGIRNVSSETDTAAPTATSAGTSTVGSAGIATSAGSEPVTGAAALFVRTDGGHDAPAVPARATTRAKTTPEQASATSDSPTSRAAPTSTSTSTSPAAPTLLPGVLLDTGELCSMSGLTNDQLTQLLSYGVLTPDNSTGDATYDGDALEIAVNAKRFLDAGIDSRHLRGWKVAADREAGLLDQLVQPLLRQRNPEARSQAVQQLLELEEVGGRLRSAMMRAALRHYTH